MATTLLTRDFLLRTLQNATPGTTDPVLDYLGRSIGASDVDTLGRDVVAPVWATATAYTIPQLVELSTGEILELTVAGTSDAAEPTPPGYGDTVVDGTATWLQITG